MNLENLLDIDFNQVKNALTQARLALAGAVGIYIAVAYKRNLDNLAQALRTFRSEKLVAGLKLHGEIRENGDITLDKVKHRIESILRRGYKALILDIDCNGGDVNESTKIYRYLKSLKLPIVAYVSDGAYSGGYMLASAAQKIVCNEYARVGSIGARREHLDISGLLKRLGIDPNPITAGKHKDMYGSYRQLTEEEIALLKKDIEEDHGEFIQAVAEGRKLGVDEVRKVAEGLTYKAKKALEFKLVDQIGSADTAVEVAKQLAGIQSEKVLKVPFYTLVPPHLFTPLSNPIHMVTTYALEIPYHIGRQFAKGIIHGISRPFD